MDAAATAARVGQAHALEPDLDELAAALVAFDPMLAMEVTEHLNARADAWEATPPDGYPRVPATLARARKYRMLAWFMASRRLDGGADLG
jgi:hypothetical protein